MRGRIEWLGEDERPVFADTFMLRAYEKAVSNLKGGLRLAVPLVKHARAGAAKRTRVQQRLNRLLETSGFQRMPV